MLGYKAALLQPAGIQCLAQGHFWRARNAVEAQNFRMKSGFVHSFNVSGLDFRPPAAAERSGLGEDPYHRLSVLPAKASDLQHQESGVLLAQSQRHLLL